MCFSEENDCGTNLPKEQVEKTVMNFGRSEHEEVSTASAL